MNPLDPVQSACQAAREALVELIGSSGDVSGSPTAFHCGACQAWFERARSQARGMSFLPRQVAEFSALDGLVVAGLNAGYRQERAAAALAWLERREVPPELDTRVSEGLGRMVRGAPDELDQRVASELSAGAGLRAERQVSALARLAAPAELEARVVRDLSRSTRPDSIPLRRWITIAATLFVVVGAATLARQAGLGSSKKPYEFKVVHTDSLASLDNFGRGFFSGHTGAILEGEQR